MRSLFFIALLLTACTGSSDPRDAATADTGPNCAIAGYGACAVGTSCVTAHCPSGTAVSCACNADGRTLCTGACFSGGDAGAIGDAFDAIDEIGSTVAPTCTLPDGSGCNAGGTCRSASCPDGASVSCTCASDGVVSCESACPACLPIGTTCGPVTTGAVCCSGTVCTRSGPTATCQPPDAGSPCGTPTMHCCMGFGEVTPVCSGTTYTCPSGSTPSAMSCVPATDA